MLSCFHNPKQKLHISGIDGVCFSSHDSCGTSLLGLDAQYLLAQAYPNMLLRIQQCPPPQSGTIDIYGGTENQTLCQWCRHSLERGTAARDDKIS